MKANEKKTDMIKESEQGSDQDASKETEPMVAADASSDAASEPEKIKSEKSHGGRTVVLIVLLIAVAVLGSLAFSGKLNPLYKSVTAMLQHSASQQQQKNVSFTESKSAATKTDAINPIKPDAIKQTAAKKMTTPASKPAPVVRPQAQPAVSSEEVRSLLSSINDLRGQLQQMSQAQQSLQNGLLEQQHMNLQVRLRWIADPASRLPQLQLTWEEISLLPGLSDDQRAEAVRMHTLARERVQQLKQWQDALSKWADALVTPTHRNILPEPERPWLAWVLSQFQLRQAPSVEAQHLGDLRARLLDAARHLTLESWPEKAAWQSLQAELLLQIRAIHHDAGDEHAEAIETGLPENFDAIQADINTLRQTARQWRQGSEL